MREGTGLFGIACVDNNWGIGKENDLLFHIKDDLKFFKQVTNHNIICMGEKTLKSLPGGKPLKNRVNIVLCREGNTYDGCICIHSLDEFINTARLLSKEHEVFITGGGFVYNAFLPYYDGVLITRVDAVDKDATVFFPDLSKDTRLKLVDKTEQEEKDKYKINLEIYWAE